MLNTRKKTMVCIYLTNLFCKVWKYLRTCTPVREIDDFDYQIWDLRSNCRDELDYQKFVGSLPFFKKQRTVDDYSDTVSNVIKIGDMGLRYSFELFIKKGDVPRMWQEPIDKHMRRELIEQTLLSHKPKPVVIDLEIKKQQQKGERKVDNERQRQRDL